MYNNIKMKHTKHKECTLRQWKLLLLNNVTDISLRKRNAHKCPISTWWKCMLVMDWPWTGAYCVMAHFSWSVNWTSHQAIHQPLV